MPLVCIPHSAPRRMFLRRGRFDGRRNGTILGCATSGDGQLTFLGHPFEGLGRTFDPVLAVIAVGREQPDHLIGAAGGRTRHIAGGKIDSLSNVESVLQHPLHRKRPAVPTVPLQRPTETRRYIAWRRPNWPVTSGHSKYADFAGFSVR